MREALLNVGGKVLPLLIGKKRAHAFVVNNSVKEARTRPHPWSAKHDYISWDGLTDKTYYARLLPSSRTDGAMAPLESPKVEDLVKLFLAGKNPQRMCPKSTCLFPAFAQYLTDGFLRTKISNTNESTDRKRTTSNHEIDLSTLYGRTNAQTTVLREPESSGTGKGRLRSWTKDGEEWSPLLFDSNGNVHNDFLDAKKQPILDMPLGFDSNTPGKSTLFAVGGDRVNAAPQTAMINTLLLREHNRLAGLISATNPSWDDDRVFETVRNCVIVMFIKIVVEEYINHINKYKFRLRAWPDVAWKAKWNRPNWMTVEFALLYRWHSLVPQKMIWSGQNFDGDQLLLNNDVLLKGGLKNAFIDHSANNATELGLENAPNFMERAERHALDQGRENKLQSYAAYRRAMGKSVPKSFRELVGKSKDSREQKRLANLAEKLAEFYGNDIEKLEFYPGLFAEQRERNGPLPELIGAMVAVDAFSQAFTNPLLSKHIWGNKKNRLSAFTKVGLDAIGATASLRDILARNSSDIGDAFVGMTRKDWKRS